MNEAIINFFPITKTSIIASNRIALYLQKALECDLIDCRKSIQKTQYDRLWIVNGNPNWSDFVYEAQHLVAKAKEIIWIGNDYAIPIWSPVRKKNFVVMAAYEKSPKSRVTQPFFYVNWNQLTFTRIFPEKFKHSGLAYYGAYREDRENYFRKYFTTDAYPVWINPSGKEDPWKALSPNINFWRSADLVSGLSNFEATLYIEDERSHTIYCSPANRFYEALGSGILMLFDKSAQGTFHKAGITIDPWIVDTPGDVARALKNREKLLQLQHQRLLSQDYIGELGRQFTIAHEQVNRYFAAKQETTILRKAAPELPSV